MVASKGDVMQTFSQSNRTALAVLAVVLGLFLLLAAPIIIQNSLDPVLENLLEVVKERPQFLSGISLFTFFYPLWRALCFIGGAALLVSVPALLKGQDWTLPVALTAYAMPSIGGMFMFLPYVSWVEGSFPLPLIITFAGLIGFWATLLLRNTDRFHKLVDWLVFTFIGMLATHAFVLGVGAARQLMTRPNQPLYNGVEWWILTMIGDINWIAAAGLIVSIPLLIMRRRAGWYVAVVAALAILLIDAPTQIIRTNTNDYLYGSLLAIGLLLWLLLPAFRERLIGERAPVAGDSRLKSEASRITLDDTSRESAIAP